MRFRLRRIKWDTVVGMTFSNAIALCIILSTAATLYAAGVRDIQTSAQAAEALRPLAGNFTFLLFSLGIIGTGTLAVPVLARSAGYAVAEAAGWRGGLSLRLDRGEGRGFYGAVAAATLGGVVLCFTPTDPVRDLFWATVGKNADTYNIGGNNEWKNIDLVQQLCDIMDELLGKPAGTSRQLITFVKDRPGHDRRYAIDASKLKNELGWEPTIRAEAGFRETARWYLENET